MEKRPAEARETIAGSLRLLVLLNSAVVVVAGLYVGQELLVPLVLAGLLAFVLAPLVRLLVRVGLPNALAVMLAVVIAFVIIGLLSLVVGQQVSALVGQLPKYQSNVLDKWHALRGTHPWLGQITDPLQSGNAGGASMLSLAERFAAPVLAPVATAAVVLVFALVMLLYSEDLRDRFVRLVGRHDLHRTIFAMNDAARRLSRYFLSQLTVNAAFGIWIGAGLALIGLPGAVLLGLIAMLMRYVPFVGTFISVAPAAALALATSPDWSLAVLVLAFFAVSEIVVSQVVEPLLYGHSTGVSPVAVLVAASFWTLLWGFVGLLIATPLTVCLVVIGRHVPMLAFLDVLLGSDSPLLPSETFYQRALEGRSLALLKVAEAQVKETSLTDYFDRVAIPALHFAQNDQVGEQVDEADEVERLDPVHDQIAQLLAELAPAAEPSEHSQIVSMPARGPLDDLAADMAAQALREAGFAAAVSAHSVLDGSGAVPALARTRLFCLSVLESDTSPAAVQYFVAGMNKAAPDARVVIGLWGADAQSALLASLRAEGGDMHVILSLGELVAYVRAIWAQGPPARLEAAHAS